MKMKKMKKIKKMMMMKMMIFAYLLFKEIAAFDWFSNSTQAVARAKRRASDEKRKKAMAEEANAKAVQHEVQRKSRRFESCVAMDGL